MGNKSTLTFCGGAGTVTGSNFLLETEGLKLLVDCGLTQGQHTAENINWEPFPYDPAAIDFLIVTHAHVDHIGRIPRLVREGFRGKIYSTEATKTLALPMLLDSMELLLLDAQAHGRTPLYDEKDIARAMELWAGTSYHTPISLAAGVNAELLDSGHILGSAMVRLSRGGMSIVFTGDLGGGNSPLLGPAEEPAGTQYLVMESVYGDRIRKDSDDRRDMLEDVIEDTVQRGGTLLIPAFSTERTQDLLYEIRTLMVEKRVPSVPVYVDSPLAQKITSAFVAHPDFFSKEMQEKVRAGEKLFDFPELTFVEGVEESRRIEKHTDSKIIIAGSGMSAGGRVQGHERTLLSDPRSTLLIVGYQAAGSLGRRLVEGAKKVRIGREEVRVQAHIEANYGYSAHMDGEQLLEFANKIADPLKQVFVVMGEPSSASFLAQRIRDYLGVKASTPEIGERAELEL